MFDWTLIETWRGLAACGLVASHAAFSLHQFRQAKAVPFSRSLPHNAFAVDTDTRTEQIWIVYASQTGQAEVIAQQTALALSSDTRRVHLRRMEDAWQAEIAHARCVLFIVSTYGEGSAPDHAVHFAQTRMTHSDQAALRGMRYGVLALGDRSYRDFCAFGRQLDAWLHASGAQPEFKRIDVDRLDAAALKNWQEQLSRLGSQATEAWSRPAQDYATWRFIERRHLNVGSPGNPVHLVVLQAPAGATPVWQAGDLVDVVVPGGDGRPRAYSIANLPGEDKIELIVRKHVREDGSTGQASGWLTELARHDDLLPMKIRSNPGFHVQHDLSRPLILIGAGTGIAGLRAHLQARAKTMARSAQPAPARNAWLFFGERSSRHDYLCQLEIEAWKRSNVLSKVDLTFSRDDPVAPYVQHNLSSQAQEVRAWVKSGAQILICGNAQRMAPGVDKALRQMLGTQEVDMLLATGRIRRDVY